MSIIENTEFISLIDEVKKKIDKFIQNEVVDKDLTKMQAVILLSIQNEDKCEVGKNVNDIVNELELNQGNTSSIIKKLESMGLVKKTRKKDDERKVNIVLTDKGKDKVCQMQEKMVRIQEKIKTTYDAAKLNKIINGIKELEDLLDFVSSKEDN